MPTQASEIISSGGKMSDAAKVMNASELVAFITPQMAYQWVKTGVWSLGEFNGWVNAVNHVAFARGFSEKGA